MAEIYASAIPIVGPDGTGVHLSWAGPPTHLHSSAGWKIERRLSRAPGPPPGACERIAIGTVTEPRERQIQLGNLVLVPGIFPIGGHPGTVCTVEIATPSTGIHGTVRSDIACVAGFRNGKAVVALGPLSGPFDVGAMPIDRLVIYVLGTSPDSSVELCRRRFDEEDWTGATVLAQLQLPVREFQPGLADEFSEAKSRLLPAETIDPDRFRDFADLLRGLAPGPRGTILVRAEEADDFDEMAALDPIRMVYSSPIWRRVLGFSFFDQDPALVAGKSYDYRISGAFPSAKRVIGFHTIPSGTQLPADFYLYDCRIRLAAPVTVERAPETAQAGLLVHTRRGIRLERRSSLPWLGGGLSGFSAVVDLPFPAEVIRFELEPGHQLSVDSGFGWGSQFSAAITVPPGPDPVVTLPGPASQLRLTGKGFLSAIIVEPRPDAAETLILSAVKLVDSPRPAPPVAAQASSLQTAQATAASADEIRPRRPLGIRVGWEPAAMTSGWSIPGASPPLAATAFRIERRREPDGAWEPVMGGDDPVLGSRDEPPRPSEIWPGADLMATFPEMSGPSGAGSHFSHQDLFLAGPDGEARSEPPAPGTMLRYRLAAIDSIGRASAAFTQTDPVRLEKHEAPPTPAGADTRSADMLPAAAPTGVAARVLVRGSELSGEDIALLGDSDNAVVLDWGWHANERETDPFATHFRIYVAPPLDSVPCELVSAAAIPARPGAFRVAALVAREIEANAAKGQYVEAGYPFYIESHGGGTSIELVLVTHVPAPGGGFRTPAPGHSSLPLNYSRRFTRPQGWSERLLPIVSITAEERYRFVLRDRLELSETHPRDSLWIGVSAADDQDYVADTFSGPQPLAGNESAVAGILCQGRRYLRPDYQPPPPAGEAARIVAPEPQAAQVNFRLDLAPFAAGSGLAGGARIFPERLDAADLLDGYEVRGGALTAVSASDARPVVIPNPQDREAILTTLEDGNHEALEDRHLVLLAALHPFRDRLFRPIREAPAETIEFEESLASNAARYLYRLRRADAAGQLSEEGFIPAVVVRVPSAAPGPRPFKEPSRADDPPFSMRIGIPQASGVTHALVFRSPAAAGTGGQLVRVPDRPDLHPAGHLAVRLDDGGIVAPEPLALSAIESGPSGWSALVEAQPPHSGPLRIWAATVTTDGMPSPLAGPWRINLPYPGPVMPLLTLSAGPDMLRLDWQWAPGEAVAVVVEQSADGRSWRRISAPIPSRRTGLDLPRSDPGTRYRLRAGAAFSNEVAS